PAPSSEADGPLRFAVQDVYRFDERRIIAGRIESGTMRVGDLIAFSPHNKTSSVASIERWNAPLRDFASAGESIGLILSDQIFVERGHIGSRDTETPIEAKRFRARIFLMGDRPFSLGKRYKVKLLTQEMECQLVSVDLVIDATSLDTFSGVRLSVVKNEVAEVTIQARSPLVMDNHDKVDTSGRFVVVDERDVAGGGIIFGGTYIQRERIQSTNLFWSEGRIDQRIRIERNGHRGMVIWLTGLSGSGKSTLARALETNLFNRHMQVYVLDGDNVRHGLNSNLGFAPDDRVENIRRVSEVAKLMADAGTVVITAFISPYRMDRSRAREIALESNAEFIEVFVDAPLEVCEARDPKNLYKKARAGQIREFTGIDAPYEAPEDPEIVVHTDRQSVDESVATILEQLLPRLRDYGADD